MLSILTAGCASPPETPLLQVTAVPSIIGQEPRAESPLAAFVRVQREAAHSAARDGRWADAQWAWDVLLALDPQDGEAVAQRATAQSAAAAAVAELMPRAQQARQHGEWDAATRLYLQVLALHPGLMAAADALRGIERQRTRRGHVTGVHSPYAGPVRRAPEPMATAHAKPARPATGSLGNGLDINDVEHASMLAAQDDVDAAIAMLRPLASGPRAPTAVRRQLAELYVRQAVKLEATDPAAAMAALQRGLALDPANERAIARLKALRSAPVPSRR